MGIQYTSGRCGNVFSGLLNKMRSHFPLRCCTMVRKASTKSNSANIMPGLKNLVGVVSLSVFRGNFVFAKVSLELISVRCMELRGLCFSEF